MKQININHVFDSSDVYIIISSALVTINLKFNYSRVKSAFIIHNFLNIFQSYGRIDKDNINISNYDIRIKIMR